MSLYNMKHKTTQDAFNEFYIAADAIKAELKKILNTLLNKIGLKI